MYTSMFRKAMLGDTATLNLDFTTGVLDSRLTFTRASTATFINSSGRVQSMGSAPTNDPTKARFDYDPVTLAPRGLLIEGTATNLLNYSESFDTSGGTNNNWADTNLTRTSTNNTSPRNDATALRITASAGNGTIISSAAIGTSASRTLSVWLRRVTGTGDIQYTLNNGTNWTTQVITSSWVRYSFAATTAAQRVGFRIVTSGDAIELWGAQLEAGSGASSYIPTGASQVTRNQDLMTLSDLSALGITNTAGTLVADFANNTENSNFAASLSFRSSVGSTYGLRFRWNTASIITTYFQSNGSTTFTTNLSGSRTSFARCKAATSYSYDGTTTSVFGSMNGAAMSTTSTTTQVASIAIPTSLRWNDDNSSGATDFPSLLMRSVKYYPSCLTIAQMNTLTTL